MAHSLAGSHFDLSTCARPNILRLKAYASSRCEMQNKRCDVVLELNEQSYNPFSISDGPKSSTAAENIAETLPVLRLDVLGLNRYPDPDPIALKQSLCKFRNNGNTATLAPANLFLAAGSDEVIDALIRCFCCPGHDTILICPPVYERYSIAAQINDVKVVEVPLDPQQSFQFQLAKVKNTLSSDPSIKLIFICSPGQPTGTMVSLEDIQDILLNASWNGVLIVDEAYIDFATERGSLATHVLLHPNLVVVQTLSKGFGLAGLRLGIAFASLDIAELLNNIRTPYNIGNLTIHVAMEAMKDTYMAMMRTNITNIRLERDRLAGELPKIRGVGLVKGELNANFLLFEVLDSPTNQGKPCNRSAMKLTESLVSRYGILVRYKGNMHGCHGSIRVTIGTEGEMTRFLEGVTSILESMYI